MIISKDRTSEALVPPNFRIFEDPLRQEFHMRDAWVAGTPRVEHVPGFLKNWDLFRQKGWLSSESQSSRVQSVQMKGWHFNCGNPCVLTQSWLRKLRTEIISLISWVDFTEFVVVSKKSSPSFLKMILSQFKRNPHPLCFLETWIGFILPCTVHVYFDVCKIQYLGLFQFWALCCLAVQTLAQDNWWIRDC